MSAWIRRIGPALALAIAATIPVDGQGRSSFGLGVLRRDGALIPFTSYNGRVWTADWPGADTNAVLPIGLGDVPKRWWGAPGPGAPWTAWLLDGTSRSLALTKPELLPVFCATHLGIRTDYEGKDFDPRDPTIAKDGIAIAGDAKLLSIAAVSLYAQDAKKIVGAITDDFNREEKTAASHFMNWQHPFDEASRMDYPIELEAFYRARESTPNGEWLTSYIEAVRRFPALLGDNDCGLITFVRGWVLERDGRKPVIDLGARITYCDRADVSFMLPFGRLIIDREPYWVYQLSSWRDELYGVSRVRPDQVRPVMAVVGGGCPRDAAVPGRGRGRGRGGADIERGGGD
jgi:hypothetical protein